MYRKVLSRFRQSIALAGSGHIPHMVAESVRVIADITWQVVLRPCGGQCKQHKLESMQTCGNINFSTIHYITFIILHHSLEACLVL